MAEAAWLQESIKDSYARDLLKEKYKEGYSYFIVLTMESTVISGINKEDDSDKFEIVLEEEAPLRDHNFTYDDKREYLHAGGSPEDFKNLERKGKLIQYVLLPLLFLILAAGYAFYYILR